MKKFNFIYLVACIFIVLYACNEQKEHKKGAGGIARIGINSTEKINFTDLFTDYRLIFPEATDSSLFGIMIQRCEVHKNRIYLLDMKRYGANMT
jgi:hypothetical protein